MAEILEFKRKAQPAAVEPVVVDAKPHFAAERIQRPAHGGFPDAIGMSLAPNGTPTLPPTPTVNDTVSAQVIKTLLFYARQGMDHGYMAQRALAGMQTAIEASAANQPTKETL